MSTKGKKSSGQFAKGTSGNPSGRPAGSRNKATLLMEALLEGEAEQLTHKAIELAKAGDTRALKLCLERLAPPCKDRLVQFDLPPARNLNEVALGVEYILAAISEGKITPPEGELLSRIVAEHAKLITTREVNERFEKLELAVSRRKDNPAFGPEETTRRQQDLRGEPTEPEKAA